MNYRCGAVLVVLGLMAAMAPSRAAALPFLTRKLQTHRGNVQIYWVAYPSANLRINGRLFVPKGAKGLPGVVYAHDGVSGLSHASVDRCAELASHGYVVLAPSYRGEDASEGTIEVAAGEVDDVLAAAHVLQQMPEVDPSRLAAIGTSHGALVVVLAAERSPVFKAIIEGYGVMDIHAWWTYLKENHFPTDDPLSVRVYGNGPQEKPEAFKRRSAIMAADRIQAPVLILQGDKDKTVPPSQADALAGALKAANKPHEIVHYAKEEHGFLIYPGDATSEKDRKDAWKHILTFLKKQLGS